MPRFRCAALTTLLLTAAFIGNARAATLPREDIQTFSQSPAKLSELRKAVEILKARPVSDPTSWFNIAAIHGIYPDDPAAANVPQTAKALWNQCHMDDSLFFLWHRAYVAAVEKLMQDAVHDPNFRLPYWDWYKDPALPEAFRSEYLDQQHTIKNSLFMANRNKYVNSGSSSWSDKLYTDYHEGVACSPKTDPCAMRVCGASAPLDSE